MKIKTWLTETFNLELPIILAPMFLVSNTEMMIAAAKAGITGCLPAHNYRTPEDFDKALTEIEAATDGAYGINLIVNKSNAYLDQHIETLLKHKPAYIITSLGSPKEVINRCSPHGIKVICDVVDVEYTKKVEALGADAVIAVNSGAGGHAGKIPASILVPMLQEATKLPVISAGGVGTGAGLFSTFAMGAEGISIGSPFIPTQECGVSQEYKQACVDYGAKDIAMTSKVSGTPCTVIKTPFVEKMGLKQNPVESFLNSNKKIKKYAKMLTYYKGMKSLEKAAFSATYKTVWCAGPSIEFAHEIETIEQIIERWTKEFDEARSSFNKRLS